MISWGGANGVSFDPDKTEVMHFSRQPQQISPAVRHEQVEKYPNVAMRWLGIWLDRALTFRPHVEKWTAKAQAVAYHLKGLTNRKHGPSPAALRTAVMACVEPVLLYGAKAWYPGKTRPRWSQPSQAASTQIQHLLKRMRKALQQGMRAILPVWKTTPIAALHRESGIPPIDQLLEARRLRFAARLRSLDEAHPLVGRTKREPTPVILRGIKREYQQRLEAFPTRLRRTDQSLATCPRPQLLQRRHASGTPVALQNASKSDSATAFRERLRTDPSTTLIVYSDGSLTEDGAPGYGYAIHDETALSAAAVPRMGQAEVFDAEALGALEGLKTALNIDCTTTHQIIVCLDNLAAATCLLGNAADSSQAAFLGVPRTGLGPWRCEGLLDPRPRGHCRE